jgi:hypothetical protein
LQKLNIIERSILHGQAVISITNYDLYNRRTQKGQPEWPPQSETGHDTNTERNKEKTQKKHKKDETNNVNKENKVKNSFLCAAAPTIRLREKLPIEQIKTFCKE